MVQQRSASTCIGVAAIVLSEADGEPARLMDVTLQWSCRESLLQLVNSGAVHLGVASGLATPQRQRARRAGLFNGLEINQ